MRFSVKAAALTGAAFVVSTSVAHATAIFNASGTAAGVGVSAQASFAISGNTLTVTLRNTSAQHAASVQDVPGSTLTGVLFDLTGNPTLIPVSALIAAGSLIQTGTCTSGNCDNTTTDVSGEFGYATGSFAHGADRAIASSGYLSTGLPGNIGNFDGGAAGTDLDSPASLDGINFGIISAADGFNPNGGLSGDPLIKDQVTFTLTGVLGLSELDISDVSFQYGTGWSETNIVGNLCTDCGHPRENIVTSEPGSLAALGFGLSTLSVWMGWRRRRSETN
jgi:hypothetical protein